VIIQSVVRCGTGVRAASLVNSLTAGDQPKLKKARRRQVWERNAEGNDWICRHFDKLSATIRADFWNAKPRFAHVFQSLQNDKIQASRAVPDPV